MERCGLNSLLLNKYCIYPKVSLGFASLHGRALKLTQAYEDIVRTHGKYINVRHINMPIASKGLNTEVCLYQVIRVQVSPGTTTVSEDSPLIFSTVQLYVPTMSL